MCVASNAFGSQALQLDPKKDTQTEAEANDKKAADKKLAASAALAQGVPPKKPYKPSDHVVEPDCLDTDLRKMDFKQRTQYLLKGGSLVMNQADTGEYTLKTTANLKGGGLFGAGVGAKIGFFTVNLLWQTGILIAAACTGPAAPATFAALELTCAPWILATSKAGAIAGGIIGGVATGPV